MTENQHLESDYVRLSEVVKDLHDPQQSDKFVRILKVAVAEGKVTAALAEDRFVLPKVFRRRLEQASPTKEVRDMMIQDGPAFRAWFEAVNTELDHVKRRPVAKPTIENIKQGKVDFTTLAEATRQKLKTAQQRGAVLGRSRKKPGKANKPRKKA